MAGADVGHAIVAEFCGLALGHSRRHVREFGKDLAAFPCTFSISYCWQRARPGRANKSGGCYEFPVCARNGVRAFLVQMALWVAALGRRLRLPRGPFTFFVSLHVSFIFVLYECVVCALSLVCSLCWFFNSYLFSFFVLVLCCRLGFILKVQIRIVGAAMASAKKQSRI